RTPRPLITREAVATLTFAQSATSRSDAMLREDVTGFRHREQHHACLLTFRALRRTVVPFRAGCMRFIGGPPLLERGDGAACRPLPSCTLTPASIVEAQGGSSMRSRTRMTALLVVAIAGFFAALAGSIHSARAAGPTLTIWVDQTRKDAVTQVVNQWAAKNPGVTINVVVQDFGGIRDKLGTVDASTAPDVIVGAHDWTGQLAANGLVEPIYLSAAVKKQFPAYTLNAFSYGLAVKKLYGVPTQIENIGLVVNTSLVKVPKTFAQLEQEALAYKKKVHASFGIAVQQGSGYDAYHMYPFFSGLGGYVFGTNSAGNLDPSNIGVANKAFLKNSNLIDKWNKEGLI